MDRHLNFIKKILLFLGFDLECKLKSFSPQIVRAYQKLKYVNLIILIVTSIIIWFEVIGDDSRSITYFITLYEGILFTQSTLRMCLLIVKIDKIYKLITDIDTLYAENFKIYSTKHIKLFTIVRRFGIGNFLFLIGPSEVIFIVNLIITSKGYFSGIPLAEIEVVNQVWPTKPIFYLPWTFLFTEWCRNTNDFTVLIVDHLLILTSTQLIVSFDRLAEEVKYVIDRSDLIPYRETKLNLAKCVNIHNKLIEFSGELNSIYGISLFAFIVQASILICLLGFIVIVGSILFKKFQFNFYLIFIRQMTL